MSWFLRACTQLPDQDGFRASTEPDCHTQGLQAEVQVSEHAHLGRNELEHAWGQFVEQVLF